MAYNGKLVWDPHPKELHDGQGLLEPRYFGLLEPLGARTKDAQPSQLDELRRKENAAFRRVMKAMPGSPQQKDLHEKWQRIRKEYLAERERAKSLHGKTAAANPNRYQMSDLLDALGIDSGEFMRRSEVQKKQLLKTAAEKLSGRGKDGAIVNAALLLTALLAWYEARKPEQPATYDLTKYIPKKRNF